MGTPAESAIHPHLKGRLTQRDVHEAGSEMTGPQLSNRLMDLDQGQENLAFGKELLILRLA